MKIMFMENREQTWFWAKIATKLEEDGHEISWIVQNAGFAPRGRDVHVIPYPRPHEKGMDLLLDGELRKVISGDRNINHYGGDASHFGYYDAQIRNILDRVQPEVVFGEATLFHELLCIKNCRKRGIIYLQPISTRYPAERFSFYLYDTPMPFHGSGMTYTEEECVEMAEKIGRREARPYLQALPGAHSQLQEWMRKIRITAYYLSGERYNTPSPLRKLSLKRRLKRNRKIWEQLAGSARGTAGKFVILFPLQLEPENNLDVWGNECRDQSKLLAALLEATDHQTMTVVKPNPRAQYEMSDELLKVLSSATRAVPVSYKRTMDGLFAAADLIVTVTGTVAMEAILAGKPVATFAKTINNEMPHCPYLRDPSDIGSVVKQVREGRFPKIAESEKVAYIQLISRTSYPGMIDNPWSTPTCVNDKNIGNVHGAFRHVLQAVEGYVQPIGRPETQTSAQMSIGNKPQDPVGAPSAR